VNRTKKIVALRSQLAEKWLFRAVDTLQSGGAKKSCAVDCGPDPAVGGSPPLSRAGR
jgi:hypothetical protein